MLIIIIICIVACIILQAILPNHITYDNVRLYCLLLCCVIILIKNIPNLIYADAIDSVSYLFGQLIAFAVFGGIIGYVVEATIFKGKFPGKR